MVKGYGGWVVGRILSRRRVEQFKPGNVIEMWPVHLPNRANVLYFTAAVRPYENFVASDSQSNSQTLRNFRQRVTVNGNHIMNGCIRLITCLRQSAKRRMDDLNTMYEVVEHLDEAEANVFMNAAVEVP